MTDSKKLFDELEADFKRNVEEANAKMNPEAVKQAAKAKKDFG
jgi:hypothetical protein